MLYETHGYSLLILWKREKKRAAAGPCARDFVLSVVSFRGSSNGMS